MKVKANTTQVQAPLWEIAEFIVQVKSKVGFKLFFFFLSSNQLLCLVGEAFDDHSDQVCGAVVNIRTKGDKLAVWTADYENREAVTHIG